jgi:hypothetical protein
MKKVFNSIIIVILLFVVILLFLILMYQQYQLQQQNLPTSKPTDVELNLNVTHQNPDPNQPPYQSTPINAPLSTPINVRTRGDSDFRQVGVITNTDKSKIFPLYGKQTYPGSNRWMYYTKNDSFHNVSLGLLNKGRDCMENNVGCDEVYNGDNLHIDELGEDFTVKIYHTKEYQYIPY